MRFMRDKAFGKYIDGNRTARDVCIIYPAPMPLAAHLCCKDVHVCPVLPSNTVQ